MPGEVKVEEGWGTKGWYAIMREGGWNENKKKTFSPFFSFPKALGNGE